MKVGFPTVQYFYFTYRKFSITLLNPLVLKVFLLIHLFDFINSSSHTKGFLLYTYFYVNSVYLVVKCFYLS